MLTGTKALLAQDVATLDGAYAAREAWLDAQRARLVYLEVETGGFLSRPRRALIHASRLSAGAPPRAEVDAAMIEAAETEPEEGFLLDPAGLPPILTGPFGNTVSPLLMMAGMRSEAVEEQAPHPDAPGTRDDSGEEPGAEADPRAALERASEWLGAPVFGRAGELGRVDDLLLAKADWATAYLIVRARTGRHAVPWAVVRHRAPGGHVVISGDAAALAGSPDIPSPDAFGGADAEAILAHWHVETGPVAS